MDRHPVMPFMSLATIAILSGGCSSERQIAARIAGETEGVQEVVNLLDLRG